MHMHMVIQLLVPGMEDLDNARHSAEVFRIGRKLQERLRTACMQEPVEKLLVAVQIFTPPGNFPTGSLPR